MSATLATRTRPRRYPLWSKLLLLSASLALMFCAAEVLLRIAGVRPRTATVLNTFFEYDPVTGWRGRPMVEAHFTISSFDTFVRHGADGFRRPHRSAPLPGSAPVVWCLGDSFAWGWGDNDDETISELLNQQSGGKATFRNLGISGYSTVQQYLLLEKLFAQEQPPDYALVFFSTNDMDENVTGPFEDPARPYVEVKGNEVSWRNTPVPPPRKIRVHPWLNRHSLAYNLLYYQLFRLREAMRNVRTSGYFAVPPPIPEEKWIAVRHVLEKMHSLCKRRGVALGVVYMPSAAEVGAMHVPEVARFQIERRTRLLQLVRELSIEVIDTAPAFAEYYASTPNPNPLNFPTDGHYNQESTRRLVAAVWANLPSHWQLALHSSNPVR